MEETYNSLQDVTNAEMPVALYHYTNITAMLSIFDRSEFWATNIQHLNDTLEFEEAIKYFNSETIGHITFANRDSEARIFRDVIIKLLEDSATLKNKLYVCSFSAADNSLEQWRAYTPKSKGVSLSLDLNTLSTFLYKRKYWKLIKCRYSPFEKTELVREFMSELEHILQKKGWYPAPPDITTDQKYDFYSEFLQKHLDELLIVLASFKHDCFVAEEEYRLVYIKHLEKEHGEKIHFRESDFSLTPFVKVNFSEVDLIKSIRLGPNQDILALNAFKLYKEQLKLNVDIIGNNLPFR